MFYLLIIYNNKNKSYMKGVSKYQIYFERWYITLSQIINNLAEYVFK